MAPAVADAQTASEAQVSNASATDLAASAAAFDLALSRGDRSALETLLAADLIWVRGSGATGGKSEFIAGLTDPSIEIEPFVPAQVKWFDGGDAALLIGVNVLRGRENGVPFVDRHRFADYWVRREDGWRLVYIQVTRLHDPD